MRQLLILLILVSKTYLINSLAIDYDSNNELIVDDRFASTEKSENSDTAANRETKADEKPIDIWPKGVVYYTIDYTLTKKTRHLIRKTLAFMTNEIGLKNDGTNCITFQQRITEIDYVRYYNGPGCWSSVGKVGKMQDISLSFDCWNRGAIMHETMHALGFWHEQQRTDRDKYLSVRMENVYDDTWTWYQFEKISNNVSGELVPFDYNSIMLYGNKAGSDNGEDTIVAKNGQPLLEPDKKVSLTYYDIKEVRVLYGCET